MRQYSGEIDGKYPISRVLKEFEIENEVYLFGYYYYDKNRIPIFVKGSVKNNNLSLIEYLDNGKANASFTAKYDIEVGGKMVGTWESSNGKRLPFVLSEILPVQNMDAVDRSINCDIDEVLNKRFSIKSQKSSGSLTIRKEKKDYYIDLLLFSEQYDDHFGELTGKLVLGYYEANPTSLRLKDTCLLFFIYFKDRIFVYEYGDPAHLDFGAGVSAEGVYVLKK